jgi:hypothetical protein
MPITRRHVKKLRNKIYFLQASMVVIKVSTLECIRNRSILKQISGEDMYKELHLLEYKDA